MRILVYEFVTGGGCAGSRIPASLAREGLAMRTALIADLASIEGHAIATTTDRRFRRAVPRGVEQVVIDSTKTEPFASLLEHVDAVWLIAPETNGCLERLAARIQKRGTLILGSSAATIGRASDKASYPGRLGRVGVRHPETLLVASTAEAPTAAQRIGYPLVVKPRRGAGGRGVYVARNPREFHRALREIRLLQTHNAVFLAGGEAAEELVIQRFVRGTPASVSLLASGRDAMVLAMNEQRFTVTTGLSYRGGRTPFEHQLTPDAMAAAIRTCAAFPGLRGYIGVDLVLSNEGPVVIEVNPRLTTAYLGVRAVIDENVARLAIEACRGTLPPQPITRRRVRFTASGLVAAA
jgi:predicted ATP-grasp superfamily ATP-dependent carboligase